MAPSAIAAPAETQVPIHTKGQAQTLINEPLKLSGSLDKYESFDVTPAIGTEFPKANVVDWLNAPNSDDLIRDLAITSTSPSSPCLLPTRAIPAIDTPWQVTFGLTPPPSLPTRRRLLPRPRRPHQQPPETAHPQARVPDGPSRHVGPAHPPAPQLGARARRRRPRGQHHQLQAVRQVLPQHHRGRRGGDQARRRAVARGYLV